jgi:Ca2+-binding EF-hand superfamily protein
LRKIFKEAPAQGHDFHNRLSTASHSVDDEDIWKHIINEIDADGDGQISKEEFNKAMLEVTKYRATVYEKK